MNERKPTPNEILMTLIVVLLTPMFLAASGGDIQSARFAAFATIQNHRTEDDAELVTVAKMIAFGLAALSALSLALTEDIGASMLIRLQASATACDRAEHRNRRVLQEKRRAPPPPPEPDPPPVEQADVIARAEQAAALARQANQQPPEPAPQQAPQPQAQQPAPAQPVQQMNRAAWANALATAAQEFAGEMPNLPPQEKWAASVRSKALSSAATDLLNGVDLEPYRLKT
jgi:hypothetical protein